MNSGQESDTGSEGQRRRPRRPRPFYESLEDLREAHSDTFSDRIAFSVLGETTFFYVVCLI